MTLVTNLATSERAASVNSTSRLTPATGRSSRISAVRTSIAFDRADIALDLLGDDRSMRTARGTGHNAFEAGFDALSRAYNIAAAFADVSVARGDFDIDGQASAEVAFAHQGEVYRGRGRGPDAVWAELCALCDALEQSGDKSVFVPSPNGSTETVPHDTTSKAE